MSAPRHLLASLFGSVLVSLASAQAPRYRGEPIRYESVAEHGPVERLLEQLESGERELPYDQQRGYLPGLLEALDIPVSSQGLVFSKTSFQTQWISPRTPRALYFGDEVYVGAVPGAPVLEITSIDPRRGPVFYTLAQGEAQRVLPERRHGECLQCHESSRTRGWPANVVRSVHTAADGLPIFNKGTFHVGHETPLEQRWGGWYVTGTHGKASHMGNVFSAEEEESGDPTAGLNLTSVSERFQAGRYLSPHSDIVALMVLEHQASMHNWITRAGYEARLALYRQEGINRAFGDPPGTLRESTARMLTDLAEEVVAYLLFRDEARLPGPIHGSSDFQAEFEARGRRDSRGRSLRAMNLKRYLFRYPCSYVIHSPSFDALPEQLLDAIYARLWEILTREEAREGYPRLSQRACDAVREILLETRSGLPSYWHEATGEGGVGR